MSRLYTPLEIVALTSKSEISTLVVEGKTDALLMRWVEKQFKLNGSVVKCDGKDSVIETSILAESRKLKNIAFLVDSDLWVVIGENKKYYNLYKTDGYCIENDIILNCSLEEYLGPDEYGIYRKARDYYAPHYYCLLMKKMSKPDVELSESVCCVINFDGEVVSAKESEEIINKECLIWKIISKEPDKIIRGKQLFEIIWKILNNPARSTKQSLDAIKENLFKLSILKGNTPNCIAGIVQHLLDYKIK